MKYILLSLSLILVSCKTLQTPTESDNANILSKLQAQQDSWNNADLDAFMEAYIKSDSIKFIGRNGVTYGWDNVLANYKSHYSTPEKMGKLGFEVIHLDPLGPFVYRMIGSYQLTFSNGSAPQKGYFTLIWQKIGREWLITSDHTT